MKCKWILSLAVLVLSACSVFEPHVDFAPAMINQTFPARTPVDKIGLFRSQMPTKKYSEIGSVRGCCGNDNNHNIDALRKKAAEMGGDAIVALEIDASGAATASVIRYDQVP